MIFEKLQIISLGLSSQVKGGGKQQNMNTQVSSYFHGNSSLSVGARLQHERKTENKFVQLFSSTSWWNDGKFSAK